MKSNSSEPGDRSATEFRLAQNDRGRGDGEGSSFLHHLGRTSRLALPVMLSRAGLVLMLTVDTAIVGHLAFAERRHRAHGAA